MSWILVEFTFHGHTCDAKISCEDGISFDDLVGLGEDLVEHIEEESDVK